MAALFAISVSLPFISRLIPRPHPSHGMASAFKNFPLTSLSATQFWDILMATISSDESIKAALAFVPRPTDVVTLTTPKCGQTMLLATLRKLSLNSLNTPTSMLSTSSANSPDTIPWLEQRLGSESLESKQPGDFRVFKSHLKCEEVEHWFELYPLTKFVTVLRAPHDVALSLYRHLRGMYVQAYLNGDSAAFDAHFSVDDIAKVDLGYEENLVCWLKQAKRRNVLVLFYEDMVADPAKALNVISDFVGVAVPRELEADILQQTSYDNMAKDEAFSNVFAGGGVYGKGRLTLTKDTIEQIDARWKEKVESALGYRSYEVMYEEVTGGMFPFPVNDIAYYKTRGM